MWTVRREIKAASRRIMRRELNITVKMSIITLVVFLVMEVIISRFNPTSYASRAESFREMLNTYVSLDTGIYLGYGLGLLVRFIITCPLLLSLYGFVLDITTPDRLRTKEDRPEFSMKYIFRFYLYSGERAKAFQIKLFVTALNFFWKAVFCGGPVYLIFNLRGPEDSIFYANSLLIYLVGFLLGYIISEIIYGRYYPAYFLVAQDPEIKVFTALRESIVMMKGFSWQFFKYRLSFLPWYVLGVLSYGIGFAYVIPFKHISDALYIRYIDSGGKFAWEQTNER